MTRRRARLPAEAVSLIVFASVIVIETLAGRMHPWFTPDTAGYLAIRSWPACLGGQRIPLYGWFVNAVFGMTGGYGLIPWLQAAAYGAAMFYLLRGLPAELFGRRARLALGFALALSNVLLIWICALVPCLLGVAALIASLTEVVALADGGRPPVASLIAPWPVRGACLPALAGVVADDRNRRGAGFRAGTAAPEGPGRPPGGLGAACRRSTISPGELGAIGGGRRFQHRLLRRLPDVGDGCADAEPRSDRAAARRRAPARHGDPRRAPAGSKPPGRRLQRPGTRPASARCSLKKSATSGFWRARTTMFFTTRWRRNRGRAKAGSRSIDA